MILDGLLVFMGTVSADNVLGGQLVTAVGSTLSTNTVDLAPTVRGGNQPGDYGAGGDIQIEISVMQTLTSAGAATVQFQLVQADTPDLATNLQVISSSPVYAYTDLVAGVVIDMPWESSAPYPPKRYLGMRTVVGTAALTNGVGQFFASVTTEVQMVRNLYYKSGYTVI
jgi:hypothetical protein